MAFSEMMFWDAELAEPFYDIEDELIDNEAHSFYSLLEKDEERLNKLPNQFRKIYEYANGVKFSWRSAKFPDVGGNLNFIELNHVLADGLGSTYEKQDLAENELIEFFKPFDLISEEAECGFLLNPGFESKEIYFRKVGSPQIYGLGVDIDGYLKMAVRSSVFYYWPKVLIDIQANDESEETKKFKKYMPEMFSDFKWESFLAEYKELQLK
jgi:hypothetical protein